MAFQLVDAVVHRGLDLHIGGDLTECGGVQAGDVDRGALHAHVVRHIAGKLRLDGVRGGGLRQHDLQLVVQHVVGVEGHVLQAFRLVLVGHDAHNLVHGTGILRVLAVRRRVHGQSDVFFGLVLPVL